MGQSGSGKKLNLDLTLKTEMFLRKYSVCRQGGGRWNLIINQIVKLSDLCGSNVTISRHNTNKLYLSHIFTCWIKFDIMRTIQPPRGKVRSFCTIVVMVVQIYQMLKGRGRPNYTTLIKDFKISRLMIFKIKVSDYLKKYPL